MAFGSGFKPRPGPLVVDLRMKTSSMKHAGPQRSLFIPSWFRGNGGWMEEGFKDRGQRRCSVISSTVVSRGHLLGLEGETGNMVSGLGVTILQRCWWLPTSKTSMP